MKKNSRGFTLIELMIVIAIIGILAGIAYPSYTSYVKQGHRADGIGGLLSLAGRMEEYYMDTDSYVGATINDAGTGTVGDNKTTDGYYTLAITVATDFTYTLTATTIPAGVDTECGNLILDSLGQKTDSEGNGNCW